MIHLLIGHRGTGKSSLLHRLAIYAKEAGEGFQAFDLDTEIEARCGQKVSEIFAVSGEAEFRRLEEETLQSIIQRAQPEVSCWIALGAGYQGPWPKECRRWWVRRSSDGSGRIFLDRPRLEASVSPYDEYMKRFRQRELRFGEVADIEITLLEGLVSPNDVERRLFGFSKGDVGGQVTLLPEQRQAWAYIKGLGPERVEARDDLLTLRDQERVAELFEPKDVVFSLRAGRQAPDLWRGAMRDWALELGQAPAFDPEILSLHERRSELSATLGALPKRSGAVLKLAVEISNWEELSEGDRWWREAPESRVFLPRSPDGRWQWYRTLFGRQQKFAFWRLGRGSAVDQPLLADWLRVKQPAHSFAAVLGDPVAYSWTPAEQADFFAPYSMPVVAVRIARDENFAAALDVLKGLGLQAAAVTSPHKVQAFEVCGERTEVARSLGAVNTLFLSSINGKWVGHNTDGIGFSHLVESSDLNSADVVAVWGGGGTRPVVVRVLPQARFFSARRGEEVIGGKAPLTEARPQTLDSLPSVVIWATGRSEPHLWPPESWAPRLVVDLNYTESSPGREYALKVGAKYLSGGTMFRAQAEGQREFWRQRLDPIVSE